MKTNFHCHIFSHRLLLSKRSTFISQINPLTSRYDECYPPDIEEKLKSCRSLAFSLSTRLIWRLLARCVKWSENICNKDCGRSDASNIRHVIFGSATLFGFRSKHWKDTANSELTSCYPTNCSNKTAFSFKHKLHTFILTSVKISWQNFWSNIVNLCLVLSDIRKTYWTQLISWLSPIIFHSQIFSFSVLLTKHFHSPNILLLFLFQIFSFSVVLYFLIHFLVRVTISCPADILVHQVRRCGQVRRLVLPQGGQAQSLSQQPTHKRKLGKQVGTLVQSI